LARDNAAVTHIKRKMISFTAAVVLAGSSSVPSLGPVGLYPEIVNKELQGYSKTKWQGRFY